MLQYIPCQKTPLVLQPTGLRLNLSTLPQELRGLGYSTHMVGKWHLGKYLPSQVELQLLSGVSQVTAPQSTLQPGEASTPSLASISALRTTSVMIATTKRPREILQLSSTLEKTRK